MCQGVDSNEPEPEPESEPEPGQKQHRSAYGLKDEAVNGDEDGDEESNLAKPQQQKKKQRRAWWGMLVSHALSAWCVRSWEFAASLLLYSVRRESLLLPALYGLFQSVIIILLGPKVGRYVDRYHRLGISSIGYAMQSIFIGLSAASILVLLVSWVHLSHNKQNLFIGMCIVFGGLSRLAGLASTLSVEKDWVPSLCKNDTTRLASLNAMFRRIDLICKIGAPLLSGFLMSYTSNLISAAVIALYSFSLWPVMYLTLRVTYHANIDILERPCASKRNSTKNDADDEITSPLLPNEKESTKAESPKKKSSIFSFSSWRTYFRQEITFAGLSLSLLYLTVLSFGALMTSYGKSRGISELTLSIMRGGGTLCGLLGTFVYPKMYSRLGSNSTGLWMLISQWVCIGASVLPFVIHIPGTQSYLLLFEGVMLSRFGLWGFDLSITHLLQVRVDEEQRAEINGVQSALQNFLNLCANVLSVVFSDPHSFNLLAFTSFCGVSLALLLYFYYLNLERIRAR